MALSNLSHRATLWIGGRNPAGLLYGAIITGAVMSATAGHGTTDRRVVTAVVFVLGVYWLADVYASAFAEQFHAGRQPLLHRLASAARHESRVLLGGVPALATFVIASLAGATTETAVDVALWVTVAGLAAIAYLAARQAGATTRQGVVEALIAASLGVAMVISKSLLH